VRLELDDTTQRCGKRKHQDTTQEPQHPLHPCATALGPSPARPRTRLSAASRTRNRERNTQRTFPSSRTPTRRCLPRSSSSSFSLSPPVRTRLLLDLPPTCIPNPDARHRNPVVGSRARVKSGLGSRVRVGEVAHARMHLPIAPVAALELPRFCKRPVVGPNARRPRSPPVCCTAAVLGCTTQRVRAMSRYCYIIIASITTKK
jgi:hypothetical protein